MGSGESHALALCMLSPESGIDRAQLQVALSSIRQQVNQGLEYHEQLAKLVIVRDEWTIANGFLRLRLRFVVVLLMHTMGLSMLLGY